jgi:hypothetical protein
VDVWKTVYFFFKHLYSAAGDSPATLWLELCAEIDSGIIGKIDGAQPSTQKL